MTTLVRSFEAPNHYEPPTCPQNTSDDCDELVQICDICDVLICPEHTREEDLVECVAVAGIFHHTECFRGCADCRGGR